MARVAKKVGFMCRRTTIYKSKKGAFIMVDGKRRYISMFPPYGAGDPKRYRGVKRR